MATNHTSAVVITGASTGIGEACALRMDRLGFRVFAGVRKEADGQALQEKASDRLTPVMIDVADAGQIAAAAETVRAAVGESGLAGLVNNAGVIVVGPLECLPLEDLRRQLEVNVIGQIAVTQAFLSLIRAGHGRIVNIGSINGLMAPPFLGPYSASKFALEALTDSLRQELRPWGIEVAIVEPGLISTRILDKGQANAAEVEKNMSEEAMNLYGDAFTALRAAYEELAEAAIPPDEVAKFVEHALTASKPKTRYLVGRDAQIQRVLANVVPDRMRDGLVQRQLKLP